MKSIFCLKKFVLFVLFAILILSCSDRQVEEMPLSPTGVYPSSSVKSLNSGPEIDSAYIDICQRAVPGIGLFDTTDEGSDAGIIIFDPEGNDCCDDINEDEYTLSPAQPEAVELLNDLLGFIEMGYFSFTNEHLKKPYRKKIEVVARMLESGNSEAARQKLINDLLPHTTAWIATEHQQEEILAFLELAEWRILNPGAGIYLPEYLVESYLEALAAYDIDAMGCRTACTAICTLTTYNIGGCILLCIILCPEPVN